MPERCQAKPWGFREGSSTFHPKAYVSVKLYTIYVSIPSNYLLLTSATTRYIQSDTGAAQSGEFEVTYLSKPPRVGACLK